MENIIITTTYNDLILGKLIQKDTVCAITNDKKAKKASEKNGVITVTKDRADYLVNDKKYAEYEKKAETFVKTQARVLTETIFDDEIKGE